LARLGARVLNNASPEVGAEDSASNIDSSSGTQDDGE